MGGHPAAGHTFPPGSAFCFWRRSRTVWLHQQQEPWRRKSLRASPAQAALPSLLSCLDPRHGRDGSPGPACFGTFLAGRRRTGNFHLFFQNFHVWGSCPWVPELGKHVGNGVCMRWGAQRDPSQPARQQVVQIRARLTRRQSRDEQSSGLLPSGCSLSPCASRVGLVAQPGHTPPTPAAASSKRLSGLLAGLSSILPVFVERLLYTWPGAGLLGFPKKGMSSLAFMAPVAFWGVVQSRLWDLWF